MVSLGIFILIGLANSMSTINEHSYFMDNSNVNDDVVDIIASKGYLPNEKYLPKTSDLKKSDNEVTYLLSKLSDEELLKLLNEHPKNTDYDLNDIVKLALDSKFLLDHKIKPGGEESRHRETFIDYKNQNSLNKHNFGSVGLSDGNKPQIAFFRLEDKPVDPYSIQTDNDPNYSAIQKLTNILYSRPLELVRDENTEDEEKKELLFDVLVSQLKTLCCKKTKPYKKEKRYQPLTNGFSQLQDRKITANEHMFLIINDEIKSNGSNELVPVDPNSLEKNSSVLLLGPITTPLNDSQLKTVMLRISTELSKPEYLPLLHQLSDGTLTGSNIKLMKSLISGSETRRYIKPHRCNHQSRMTKIYGGPKWIICTGYLNLNTPSIYD